MTQFTVRYKGLRFPVQCLRFPLSMRLIEKTLLERGIVMSRETIRCRRKFGPEYAVRLRPKQPSVSDIDLASMR